MKYVIVDGNDVNVFGSKDAAEAYMEAIDVRNGVYTGFDATGRLLTISPKEQVSEIALAETEPQHVEDLRRVLIKYLRAIGHEIKKDDLKSLLDVVPLAG